MLTHADPQSRWPVLGFPSGPELFHAIPNVVAGYFDSAREVNSSPRWGEENAERCSTQRGSRGRAFFLQDLRATILPVSMDNLKLPIA
jgi:hypothetical protein